MKPALRFAAFIAAFIAALVLTLSWIRGGLDAAGIETEAITRHGVANYYSDRVDAYLEHPLREGQYRVAFLGDSMVVSYPASHQIPAMVQRQVRKLRRSAPGAVVHNLGLAGTGVYDYYFMADVIGRLDPDLVIIAFNLTSTSRDFQAAFSRPELAGWVSARRIVETLFLPVNWIGLTADRLFLYKGVIASGGFDRWVELNEEQMRVAQARARLETAMATRDAEDMSAEERFRKRRGFWLLARNNAKGGTRHTAHATRNHLGATLDGLEADHPVVETLGAAVRTYRDRGADVLVYLNPVNIDHAASLGLLDRERLDQSIRIASEEVTRSGGHVVDLHALFPDDGFRDRSGHFTYEGKINGPRVLASKLAPAVVELMQHGTAARGGEK
ncbi:MAG: hypothetical protein QF570_12860 [Myxococcota bacterium]|jgi:hypothetical protein|nr:hypothetical protein [Myxococcota bacterium]